MRGEVTRSEAPERTELEAMEELERIYGEVDRAMEGWSCDASTDCCRFGITNREPYITLVELRSLERAIRARGGLPKQRLLPVVRERRCPLLSDQGRCLVYAARPLGCRTYYCRRAEGPGHPKKTIADAVMRIATLSARLDPRDEGPRPLSSSLSLTRRRGQNRR